MIFLPHARSTTHGTNLVGFRGTLIWNQLPSSIKSSKPIIVFKTNLKQLFNIECFYICSLVFYQYLEGFYQLQINNNNLILFFFSLNTGFKENGTKLTNVREFTINYKNCTKQSRYDITGLLHESTNYIIFGGKSLEVHEVQY